MHTHRVYVFHIADRNAGVSRIAHDLILKLFPSEDAFFDENLADSRLFDPAFDYILQLSVSSGYTASPTSKSVRRQYSFHPRTLSSTRTWPIRDFLIPPSIISFN